MIFYDKDVFYGKSRFRKLPLYGLAMDAARSRYIEDFNNKLQSYIESFDQDDYLAVRQLILDEQVASADREKIAQKNTLKQLSKDKV